MKFLILLASLCGIASVVCDVDWCDPKYCPPNTYHIACNHNHKKSASCPSDFQMVPFTEELKTLVLAEHNKLRNQQALGKTPKFGPAKWMASMTWDDKLAEFAELNVMQCEMKFDYCRSTEKLYFAGQNLHNSSVINDKQLITETIKEWFDESKLATMDDIRKFGYGVNAAGEIFAHFTQVVRDEAYKIGCAISRFSDPINKKPLSLITCNYAVTNLATFPVYEEGDAASGCKTGPHPNYPGLCSESEVYDGQFFHPMSEELKSTFDAVSEDCPLNKH